MITEKNRYCAQYAAVRGESAMKWKNKGHEFDQAADNYLKNIEKLKRIYVFGAGLIGTNIMLTMQEYGMFAGFIDNDIQKQQDGYKGCRVYSVEEYMKVKSGFIVVAVSEKNGPYIIEQLEALGLLRNEDFVLHTEFCNLMFPIISLYWFGKLYVNVAQICLTERCSLKCKKCAHGCFAIDNSTANDLTLDQVYKSADSFFDKVDFVQEFVLIGGEPLLYTKISEAIAYIGERYRKKIGNFSITTNGTILPDENMIKMCKTHNVSFSISNYSVSLPRLRSSYKKLTDLLEEQAISYYLEKEEGQWRDYGFDYVNRNASENELMTVFDTCRTSCREIRENRFYFCVMARSVADNMNFNVGSEDYIDLDNLRGGGIEAKKELLEFNLGYSSKGYLDMCNYCHGADADKYPIPMAEQT